MTYVFYGLVGIVLVLLETTLLPVWSMGDLTYDLLLPLVIFVSVFRPAREGIFVIIVFGILLDRLSGGRFGLYLTTYFWLFMGVKIAQGVIQVKNFPALMLISTFGVIFENFLFLGCAATVKPGLPSLDCVAGVVARQVLLAALTVPVLILVLKQLLPRWCQWRIGRFPDDQPFP